MTFKKYRSTETIDAAEIDVDELRLPSALDENQEIVTYHKGDFVEVRNGVMVGYAKDEFKFAPLRNREQPPAKKRAPRIKPTPAGSEPQGGA